MKSVCKKIRLPGFVNLLGPLTNPYETSFHLLGVSNLKWGEILSLVLKNSKKHSIIVCSKISENTYLDEFSFSGTNHIWKIEPNKEIIQNKIMPEDIGLPLINIEHLKIVNKEENKLVFESVLKGKFISTKEKECIKVTALNTGAALFLAKRTPSLKEGYETALRHIQSGITWEHFQDFINFTK